MKWYEFLITYWSQVTVIITAIGGLIKILVDARNKRLETKFNLFYKERMEYTIKFFETYFDASTSISSYMYKCVWDRVDNKEMHERFFDKVKALSLSYSFMELLYPSNISNQMKTVVKNFQGSEQDFAGVIFWSTKNVGNTTEFRRRVDEINKNRIEASDKIITELGKQVRREFGT